MSPAVTERKKAMYLNHHSTVIDPLDIRAKVSMHIGKTYSVKHNLREYDATKWNTDGHIQPERSALNQILTHTNLKDYFKDTFGEAIEEYNEKNKSKHPDRVMSLNEYYNKYKGHAQECIMQLGNHENYLELVQQLGQKYADELHIKFLTQLYQQWTKDNPSLKVFSAVIHMDETKDGTPHLHLDFLPVSESTRGLSVKVSMDGAMKQLGFNRKTKAKDGQNDSYNDTPYKRWLAHQREQVESLASQYITLIPSETFCKARRQETWEWRAEQKETLAEDVRRLSDEKEQTEHELGSLKAEYNRYQDIKVSDEEMKQEIKVKKSLLGKKQTVMLDKDDFELLQQQALAYRANIDRLKDESDAELDYFILEERLYETTLAYNKAQSDKNTAKQELKKAKEQSTQMLKNAEYKAGLAVRTAKRQATLILDEANSMYNRQLEVNKLLEQTERNRDNVKKWGESILASHKRDKAEWQQKEKEYTDLLASKDSQIEELKAENTQLKEKNSKLSKIVTATRNNIVTLLKHILSLGNLLSSIVKTHKEIELPVLAGLNFAISHSTALAKGVPLDETRRSEINECLESNDIMDNIQALYDCELNRLQEKEKQEPMFSKEKLMSDDYKPTSEGRYISHGGMSR